jgi:hypothetical protein
MKNFFIHLILAAFSASSFAQDTIVFKNGDALTGTILKQDAQHVYFKSPAFGSVSLSTKDISEIRIEDPTLGEVSIPAAVLAPEPTAPKSKGSAPAKVSGKKGPNPKAKPKSKDAWSGQSGLSIAMRESNSLRRAGENLVEKNEEFESYRVYGNVKWKGDKNNLRWDWTYRYSRTDVRKNDDYLNITQNYQHNFTDKYYATTKTLYQRDFRRGIEREYLQTAELGVKWINKPPKLTLTTSVGGGYHQYDRLDREFSNTDGKFILDQSLRWQLINSLTLFQKYTHLGSVKDYHQKFTSGLENKLIRDIFLRLEYRLDRDTDVNYDDRGYYDRALLTSLLYKF